MEGNLSSLVNDTFVRSVTHFDETDSTNSRAIELLAAGDKAEMPWLIYAENQIAGRGRGTNQWWSTTGSLTFSVVIDFQDVGLSTGQKPLLPLLTGLAILRTGQAILPTGDFKLKWPNDVFLSGRKLAGILIEVPSQTSTLAVIGIGLNVNNRFSSAPDSLQNTAISLADKTGSPHDRTYILRLFLDNMEAILNTHVSRSDFQSDWSTQCLLTGKQVTLQTGSTDVTGICRGIDESGALILETPNGQQPFFSGVVKSWN